MSNINAPDFKTDQAFVDRITSIYDPAPGTMMAVILERLAVAIAARDEALSILGAANDARVAAEAARMAAIDIDDYEAAAHQAGIATAAAESAERKAAAREESARMVTSLRKSIPNGIDHAVKSCRDIVRDVERLEKERVAAVTRYETERGRLTDKYFELTGRTLTGFADDESAE